MPIEAVKIPQNVYIEDRIIGPITLRQIIMMAIGGGISYAMYASLVKMYGGLDPVSTFLVWTPALIFAAFAFVKINDLSLGRIVLLTIERMMKAPVRTFAPRQGISINIKLLAQLNEQENAKKRRLVLTDKEARPEEKIRKLSALIDTAFAGTEAASDVAEEAPVAEETPVVVRDVEAKSTLPVNKNRIAVDGKPAGEFSDMSAFSDILPPTTR